MSYRGHNDRSAAQYGERILFWREKSSELFDEMKKFLPSLFAIGQKGDDPKDFVRNDIPYADRKELAEVLVLRTTMNPNGGDYGIAYMGWANCRICNAQLGTHDMFGYGFVWPEKAEHYLMNHNVWTPGCDRLLAAVRLQTRSRRGR